MHFQLSWSNLAGWQKLFLHSWQPDRFTHLGGEYFGYTWSFTQIFTALLKHFSLLQILWRQMGDHIRGFKPVSVCNMVTATGNLSVQKQRILKLELLCQQSWDLSQPSSHGLTDPGQRRLNTWLEVYQAACGKGYSCTYQAAAAVSDRAGLAETFDST